MPAVLKIMKTRKNTMKTFLIAFPLFLINFSISHAMGFGLVEESSPVRAFASESTDLDGDGDIDIVYGHNALQKISVLLNNGNGTFSKSEVPISSYSVQSGGLILKDLDNDSDIDVVVNDAESNGVVSFLFNDGTGHFLSSSSLVLPRGSAALASLDFDNDSDTDIVAVTPRTSLNRGLYLLENVGGSFTIKSFINGGVMPTGVVTADVDSDGDYDIVTMSNDPDVVSQNGLNVLLNSGAGSFSSPIFTQGTEGALRLVSLDIDKDGDSDFATVDNQEQGSVTTYRNSSGTLSKGQVVQLSPFPNSITVADVNKDGFVDIVVAGGWNKNVSILLNDVNGIFHLDADLIAPGSPQTVTASDYNGDGYTDLATSYYKGSNENNTYFGYYFQEGPSNSAPTLTTINNKTVSEGSELTFLISATDPENDPLILGAINLPAGVTFNPATGTFSWTPGYTAAGTYQVSFTATENTTAALNDSKTVTINVTNTNRPPVITSIDNKTVDEGQTISFPIITIDPDGDAVTLSATNIPTGATFNPSTGIFSWTPGYSTSGNYSDVQFVATDDGSPMELALELVTITVGDVNRAPDITNPGPQAVLEGHTLTFPVTVTDPDGNTVTLSATGLPSGATFNSSTGIFSWTPGTTAAGVYTITFAATDNGIPATTAASDVLITVGDVPTPIEQTQTLINTIVSFNLPTNLLNSYLANLQKVEPFILDGKITAAINQINAVLTKAQQDYQKGKLTLAQYQTIVSAANALKANLL